MVPTKNERKGFLVIDDNNKYLQQALRKNAKPNSRFKSFSVFSNSFFRNLHNSYKILKKLIK